MTEHADIDEVIHLKGRMDLMVATSLRLRILESVRDIRVDASGVEVLTSSVLQVLLAAATHQRNNGVRLVIDPVSEGFAASVKMLGTTLSRMQVLEPEA